LGQAKKRNRHKKRPGAQQTKRKLEKQKQQTAVATEALEAAQGEAVEVA